MFTIGDKIVYPMHGAGVIEQIEEKNILGKDRNYYILKVPNGDMKIMIPVDSAEEIGVREIVSEDQLSDMLTLLKSDTTQMSNNWNKRYRDNQEKLKSGDIFQVAEVVRNLVHTDRGKKLSTGEKKMLSNAKQILISEMILVKDVNQDEANDIINESIK